jgi:hypothetical protein
MKNSCCCGVQSNQSSAQLTGVQRAMRIINWVLPSIVLAAMPKCPVCVAAYVMLLTGCGISIGAAASLRWLAISVCVLSLLFVAVKTALRPSV